MPGYEDRGDEDRREDQGNGHDRPRNLFHGLERRLLRRQAFLDVAFHRLHHDDGVVHDQSDGQHQAEERQGVDRESEQGKDGKGADEGDRNGKGRNERRPPSLKEDEDHEDDEGQRFKKRFDDLADSFVDGSCRVEGNGIVEVGREPFLGLLHHLPDALDRGKGIRARQLVDGHDAGGLAVDPAPDVVSLRPQFDPGHVLQPDDRSVRVGADNDGAEFLRRDEAALGADRIGEFLPRGDRLAADLSGRVDRVLLLDGIDDIGDGDAELAQGVGLDPDADRILACAEDVDHGDAGHADELDR